MHMRNYDKGVCCLITWTMIFLVSAVASGGNSTPLRSTTSIFSSTSTLIQLVLRTA